MGLKYLLKFFVRTCIGNDCFLYIYIICSIITPVINQFTIYLKGPMRLEPLSRNQFKDRNREFSQNILEYAIGRVK